jgi:hypothetical protein
MSNWDFSTWDTGTVGLFIGGIIAVMWIFPVAAFLLFRYISRRGEKRQADETPHAGVTNLSKGSQSQAYNVSGL